MIRIAVLLLAILLANLSFAQQTQIKIIPQNKEEFSSLKIVEKLVSGGLEILEIKTNFTEGSLGMGYFYDPVRYLGMEQGMILSTGAVFELTGENKEEDYTSSAIEFDSLAGTMIISNDSGVDSVVASDQDAAIFCDQESGDDDLSNEIEGLITYDARVVEVKFRATADTFYYRYVFASEEYDEYVCSRFNDIFAFYLTDEEGIKINTALIPNTTVPVSINTINGGNPKQPDCPGSHSFLYQRNNGAQNLIFDGFTKVLDIRQKVIPGKVYTIKIAVADASDCLLDSAVLLEKNSVFTYFKAFEVAFPNDSSLPLNPKELAEVITFIQAHPNCKIQLVGHSDRVGSIDYNYQLSVERVISIRELLKQGGVKEDRIFETYKGESMPRYKNISKNRRVEIFILGE